MDPSFACEDGANGKLGTWMEIWLANSVNDTGECVGCGAELGDGERLYGRVGGKNSDGTIGIRVG